MSADSPRRGSRGTGNVVRPQPVSDKTLVESVVNFFSDVALTSGNPKADDKEKVQWVKFERADINDVNSNPDCQPRSGVIGSLLIVIGYTNGVQIWTVPASGEAQELLSLRQGPIRILRLLPNPTNVFERRDIHVTKRPLVAMCDASSAGVPYCCVKFVSLRSGDEVHNIAFNHPITDVQSNDRVVVVAFPEKIAVFDACAFQQLFWITTCYPSPSHNPNPIALGSRWLAYADNKLVPVHQSCGGMTGDGGQSYAATVISAAKTLTKGLSMFSETVASSLTGCKPMHTPQKKDSSTKEGNGGTKPGVVTIVDVQSVGTGQVAVQDDCDGDGFIAHFPAHATEPISALAFDPSGTLLLTADRLGHNFHLFRVLAHPTSCSLGAVHHLYTLHRGDTTAKVQDMAFTVDSRWVAISTVRGTTHIFPITSYGGAVTVRTHTSDRMVNRASRFHRSAGLDDFESVPSGRDSPAPTASPGSSPGRHDNYRHHNANTVNNNFGNPRLPPFPHPTTVLPVVQVKHGLNIPGLGGGAGVTSGKTKNKAVRQSATVLGDVICVAACWAPSRGWVAGSPTLSRDKADKKRPVDSLYILNWMGNLIEYVLDPRPKTTSDKITDESPLEVVICPRAQWSLVRSITATELRPPLPSNSQLILATDAVITGKPSGELSGYGMGVRQESKESLSSEHSVKDDTEEQWLSQVEIITHVGPHRRLWMGPQFTFKTFQGSGTTTILPSNPSVLLSQSPEGQAVSTMDIVGEDVDLQSLKINQPRSSPVSMPGTSTRRSHRLSSGSDNYNPSPMATFIEAGSYEQSPSVLEGTIGWPEAQAPIQSGGVTEDLLREHLADAMTETPHHRQGPSSQDLDGGSLENLSTSSGSVSSGMRSHSFDARSSPPHSMEHVLVFPSSAGGGGSPDSS